MKKKKQSSNNEDGNENQRKKPTLKNKGYAQLMLTSFFLIEILRVLAHFGYNPVTINLPYHNILMNYENIAKFLTGQADISNAPTNKLKLPSNHLPSTFFHRILFLYYIYMTNPATVDLNYDALFKYYDKREFEVEGFGQRFSKLNILKFQDFFKKIYNFEIIKSGDDNYNDEYKRMVDALDLIDNSNFFIPDEIEETNTDELHELEKPDQLEINNRSQHDILLDMFTMALYDNDHKRFGENMKIPFQRNQNFKVNEFYNLFQTILNVTNNNNAIICPEQKQKEKPKQSNNNNKNNEKDKNDPDYNPDSDNEEGETDE